MAQFVPTVVSEKKGAYICELILERYIYLRNTQKQLKITIYVRNKSFLEFCLVYNGVCLKLLRSLFWKLGGFAPLCYKIDFGYKVDFASQLWMF